MTFFIFFFLRGKETGSLTWHGCACFFSYCPLMFVGGLLFSSARTACFIQCESEVRLMVSSSADYGTEYKE